MTSGCILHCAAVLISVWASEPTLPLDLNKDFQIQTQGPWQTRYDHRALLVMRHPWQPSKKGNFALSWKMVDTPSDWTGPIQLSFYCSDDYHTDSWRPDGSSATAEGFIGHRYKQVLVDNQVVWSQDVSDPATPPAPPQIRITLPVKPGQTFRLSLLAYDAEGSATGLPNDFYQSANNQKKREEDPDAARFLTHIYWGDILLSNGDVEIPAGKRPIEAKVRSIHNKRWPLPHFGDGWDSKKVRLEVSAPAGLPKAGFPVQMGIPLPVGKAEDPAGIRFQRTNGQPLFSQKLVTAVWPDDSLRWVFTDFPVKPGTNAVDLIFGKDDAKTPAPIEIKVSKECIAAKTSMLEFSLAQSPPISKIQYQGSTKIESIQVSIEVNGEEIPGSTTQFEAKEKGPYRFTLYSEGQFATAEKSVGAYAMYCTAWADLPYIRIYFRYFNNTQTDTKTSKLFLSMNLPDAPSAYRLPEGEQKPEFSLSQKDANKRTLNNTDTDPRSPVFLAWNDSLLVPKQFRERFPRALHTETKRIVLDLAAGEGNPVVFTPGEASSHEVWLAFGCPDAAQVAATVHCPPIVQHAEYFCATGVIGPAHPHQAVPKLEQKMTETYQGKTWEELGQHFGIRDFPDAPYYGGLPEWSNNYGERMLGLWSEWFLSGDRAWYDRAVDVCQHMMDVGIIHSEVPGHAWIGAMHGPGKNHVPGPWNPTLRAQGLEIYQKITGTPESHDAFLGVADYCLRAKAGLGANSPRQQAGPFDTICSAYEETLDPALLEAGAERLASAWKTIDRRRGAWPDEHGSKVYRGNVPWMMAQMGRPAYWWYRLTGDVEAAQLVVGLAESILCENAEWDQPGAVYGYSHNPRYPMTALYDPLILPVIFAAYELTEDPYFLDAATAQWRRWVESKEWDSVFNTYWNTPWLVWYLNQYKLTATPSEK